MSATLDGVSKRADLRQAIQRHLTYSLAQPPEGYRVADVFQAVSLAVRDRLVEQHLATERRHHQQQVKRLYYLSMEFLIGRSLTNNLANLGLLEECRQAITDLGFDPAEIEEAETDAALGNGGLGRLAACFLDSLATLQLPGHGYGINYEYGLFRQEIRNGEQIERPDSWRSNGCPWLIEHPQDAVIVPIYGRVEHTHDRFGGYNPMWLDWKMVIGVPGDMLIVGHGGRSVNYLRLFTARAYQEVDLAIFNEGDYVAAVHQQVMSETISKVLYPSEAVKAGRELRLVQEYFLVACSIRDIVRRYQRENPGSFDRFPDRVAIQLNDTHPTLAIAELMRIFVDENDLPWERAWELTTATFAYTNHTLLPEALERWPVTMLEYVLPRHLQIIFEINARFLKAVAQRWPGDPARLARMSIIEEGDEKQVRMAHLAIVGSHAVNGVAAVHSELVKTQLVPDFHAYWPEKFQNKTNGVTPRRWLLSANPALARLISDAIGTAWISNLDRLHDLEPLATDGNFQEQFRMVKRGNKLRLGRIIYNDLGLRLMPDAMFDVQIKRLHEYKRQLLNLLHVIHRYLKLVDDHMETIAPRVCLFAGKAAPGYRLAKQIIRLINDVADVINTDPRTEGRLQVLFVPDYRVTLAERLIPSADLSEQISTAGTEASGTGNMKFAMNGALTIGTLDGANIEIREEVGAENFFLFGLTVPEVQALKAAGPYRPWDYYHQSAAIARVLDALRGNRFCPGRPGQHHWVFDRLLSEHEQYLHLADLDSYLQAQDQVNDVYRDPTEWTKRAILNVARIGKFSSDRTIADYARDIWGITPCKD